MKEIEKLTIKKIIASIKKIPTKHNGTFIHLEVYKSQVLEVLNKLL